MTTDAKVLGKLLSLWEEALAGGRDVPAAELCHDYPDLVAALEQHIEAVRRLDGLARAAPNAVTTDPVPTTPAAPRAGEWPSPPGYEIVGKLGQGGMGVVYEARHRDSGQVVALKVIRGMTAEALARFKREFRSLAGLTHPNLASLHELVFDGRQWFFTMERVEGNDFLAHVRGSGPTSPAGPTWDRLRRALAGLATGLTALHEAGRLHRDVKPSNVLVAKDGRVVILDFGLAAELSGEGLYESEEQHVVGTIAYMAPEQAASKPVSAAGDWYSVGVMLYQALTGHLPFSGPPLQVLQNKQHADPPPPGALAPHLPDDLAKLCVELLRRDPRQRPAGREVLRRFGASPVGAAAAALPHPLTPGQVPLVGRTEHLAALSEALATVRQGRPALVRLHGRSGVGKSALMRCFLDGLRGCADTVVLSGRCYEQESVPYKALDSLVDTLCQYLKQVTPDEAKALLPRDVAALARVFPVLGQVPAVAGAPQRAAEVPDLQELRRRAVASLRDLLARLGERKVLVLAIDDLQWGDVDSAAILMELLQPPDPPVLLLLGCYRSEDLKDSPFLRAFLQTAASPSVGGAGRELTVDPLTPAEARDLALTLLEPLSPTAEAQAEAVARESGGNPFFVHELVQNLGTGGPVEGRGVAKEVDLDKVLWARIARLPDEARRLLEVLAVAGHPLAQETACRAAGLETTSRSALSFLRSGRLIRGRGFAGGQEVEPYHDRVRETTVSHLAPVVLGETHRRLALALETSDGVDPELLATHFQGAGEAERAGRYYARAGDQAAQALAFDRAARLYRAALELRLPTGDEGRALRTRLADALANAGRGAEAAREYQVAAASAGAAEALDLQRLAAYQYLIAGYFDPGRAALRTVLDAAGMKWPTTPRRALVSLLCRRAWLRLRGLGFRERGAGSFSAAELTRLDVCWSTSIGLGVIDIIRAADFQSRYLLLALRAGDPFRITRALALEAIHTAAGGWRTRRRTAELLRVADGLARQLDHPYAAGVVALGQGAAGWLEGRYREAVTNLTRAEGLFRDRCTGAAWELDTAQTYRLVTLVSLGELRELSRLGPAYLREYQGRGDLYAATNVSAYVMPVVGLAADDPDGAEELLRQAMARWSQQGFHMQHLMAMISAAEIHLYRGEGRAAWGHLAAQWPGYVRSLLTRVQNAHVQALYARGRSALAAAAEAADARPFWGAAERDVRALARERAPAAQGFAGLLRAGLARARGNPDAACAELRAVIPQFEALDAGLHAAAVRRHLGLLLGGDEGRALLVQADAWLTAQQVRNPARLAAALLPGFPEGRSR